MPFPITPEISDVITSSYPYIPSIVTVPSISLYKIYCEFVIFPIKLGDVTVIDNILPPSPISIKYELLNPNCLTVPLTENWYVKGSAYWDAPWTLTITFWFS